MNSRLIFNFVSLKEMNKTDTINKLEKFFKKKIFNKNLEMVFLYGSYGKGVPKEESDIDLAIVFCNDTENDDEIFDCINSISLALEKVLSREVNIIAIRRDFKHPMLYYNAIVLGVPIFIRDYSKYISLSNEAIYQMEDFSIFGLSWQLEAAKRNLEGLRDG